MKQASERVAAQTGNRYYGVGGFTSIKAFFANGVNFTGRSSRREYWWLQLFAVIVSIVLIGAVIALFSSAMGADAVQDSVPHLLWSFVIVILIALVAFIPSLALAVRRFRDAGVHWGVYVALNVAEYAVSFGLNKQATLQLVLLLMIGIAMLVITVLPTKHPPVAG